MFSVGPRPGGLCIFCRRQILVLATEELDCSRRGLQRLPTELDARFASSCVGQANKQRAVAQQNNASHAVSLQRTHSTSFASIAPDLDVRSSARTRRNPRVLACLLQLWLRKPAQARPTSDSPTQAVRGRPVVPLQEKGGLERPRVYRVVIGRRVSSACVSHNRRVLDARRGRHVISSAQATGTAPGPTGRRPAATGWTSRGLEFATPAASRARPPV